MLGLHDPACIAAVHQYRLQQDAKLTQPKQQSLEDVYKECVKVYSEWFKWLHRQYSDHEMLSTTVRTNSATAAAAQSPGTDATVRMTADIASQILQAAGLQRVEGPAMQWSHAVAASEGCNVADLVEQLQHTMVICSLMQQLDSNDQLSSEVDNFASKSATSSSTNCMLALACHQASARCIRARCRKQRLCCYPAHDGAVEVSCTAESAAFNVLDGQRIGATQGTSTLLANSHCQML